jgi:hypothetical protein
MATHPYIESQTPSDNTYHTTYTVTDINNHELLKEAVLDAFRAEYGLYILQDNEVNNLTSFFNYIVSINIFMFFTLDNIKEIVTYINNDVTTRNFILNLTDKATIEYLGKDGQLESIINDIVTMVEYNKNAPKLYDERLADSLVFDADDLTNTLSNNYFIVICYYLCIQRVHMLDVIKTLNT